MNWLKHALAVVVVWVVENGATRRKRSEWNCVVCGGLPYEQPTVLYIVKEERPPPAPVLFSRDKKGTPHIPPKEIIVKMRPGLALPLCEIVIPLECTVPDKFPQ